METTFEEVEYAYVEFTEDDENSRKTRKTLATCDQCGKRFSNVYTLSAHKNQVHMGIKDFSCNLCDGMFPTKYKLQRHCLGVHSEKRDFHCSLCTQSFKTRDQLLKHQRTHFQGPFSCTSCNEVFKFKSGLDHHNKMKHAEKYAIVKEPKLKCDMVFGCSACDKTCRSMKLLERHQAQMHGDPDEDQQFQCNIQNCSKTFKSSRDRTKHEKADHKEIVLYTCRYCLKVYKSKANFEIHISSHEKGEEMQDYEFLIESPDEIIEEEWDEDDIEKEQTPEDLLKKIDESLVSVVKIESEIFVDDLIEQDEDNCYAKDESLETVVEEESNEHIHYLMDDEAECYLIEQDDGMELYETVIAENLEASTLNVDDAMSQNSKYILTNDNSVEQIGSEDDAEGLQIVKMSNESTKNKKRDSRGVVLIVCHECGSTFKNKSHLRRHIQRKHRKEDYKLECDVCGAKFLLNYDLKRHMVKHSTARDFSCDQCEQKFKTSLSLKNHQKTLHESENKQLKSFSCHLCDRSYVHQRHLLYHLRKHTGDSRHRCDICVPEKLFFYSDAVKWHRIRHHDEPAPFSCTICDKKFIHEKSHTSHEKEHQPGTGSLSVTCPICNKSVSEKRHLKRHIRSHGGKEFVCACGEAFKERHQLTK